MTQVLSRKEAGGVVGAKSKTMTTVRGVKLHCRSTRRQRRKHGKDKEVGGVVDKGISSNCFQPIGRSEKEAKNPLSQGARASANTEKQTKRKLEKKKTLLKTKHHS